MKTLLLAGAAALAAISVPAAAQNAVAVDASGDVYVLTAEQEAAVKAWPAERATLYKTWPYNYQEYYWTLDPSSQDGWWMLSDEQRTQIYALTPEQRAMAWAQIHSQMGHHNTTATVATTAAAMASTEGPRFVAREVVQSTPASAMATANVAAKDLPVCKGDQQDGCINSWDKNRSGTRELPYWPGKPASETPGKKSMN